MSALVIAVDQSELAVKHAASAVWSHHRLSLHNLDSLYCITITAISFGLDFFSFRVEVRGPAWRIHGSTQLRQVFLSLWLI